MKASRYLFLFVSLGIGFCLIATSVPASCPDCYLDHVAMRRHGTSANGRPIVRVKLTGAWDTSPGQSDPRMYNAVRDAVRDWNSATDPATGRGAFYEFQFNDQTQSANNSDVNIRIVKMPADDKGPAHMSGPAGGPYNINIPADAADKCSHAALVEKIKHELGHPQGLAHKEKGFGKCQGSEASMMDAPTKVTAACLQYFRNIQPRDVQVSNSVDDPAFRQGNCKSIGEGMGAGKDLVTPTPTPTPAPPSTGGCYTYQDWDSYYVGEGCWHDYWTVIIICDGYLVHFSQIDLDVSCY